ncbi:hypothetical protein KTC96_15700 [Clostridium estertheticum]|uniref:hypothetical protein n=1 Tax=Clostridium estertheticum TaxID=238834 RepID=UPI001C7D35E6|nr:hypothetical protein [Clostridium estertheticum]MBX4259337.1 hypothetical protein [Clostridium estertheticum]WLC69401.1 hypothetical protein KTC96_15700 [Clostridium estertheticum]
MSHRHRDCCCERKCEPVCRCGNNSCGGGFGNGCGNSFGNCGAGSGIWILLLLLGCGGIGGRGGRGCGGCGGGFGGLF